MIFLFYTYICRWWEEGDSCGGNYERWRDVAGVHFRAPGETQQVRQILVLVLLVTGGRGAGPAWDQGNCGSSVG